MKIYFLSLITLASMGVFGFGTEAATKKVETPNQNAGSGVNCYCESTTAICSDSTGNLCTQHYSSNCGWKSGTTQQRGSGPVSIDESKINSTKSATMPAGPYKCVLTNRYQCTGKGGALACSHNVDP
ncbi:MAG: hypothetical protein J0L93_06145 [Deltaproteobacteria bacterium]|nr:hypothetical protein [Deltaproteobacteria bacterium]